MSDGVGVVLAATLFVCMFLWVGYSCGEEERNGYHASWCAEQLAHAPTASDSLAVYRKDSWCVDHAGLQKGSGT